MGIVYILSLANQEARLRNAISRAYYAAFIKARNYLRDEEGCIIPKTGDVHKYIREQFDQSSNSTQKVVAENLNLLRSYRNQADYVDKFPGLSEITQSALRRSEEVISALDNL